jgi:hypothetical protein
MLRSCLRIPRTVVPLIYSCSASAIPSSRLLSPVNLICNDLLQWPLHPLTFPVYLYAHPLASLLVLLAFPVLQRPPHSPPSRIHKSAPSVLVTRCFYTCGFHLTLHHRSSVLRHHIALHSSLRLFGQPLVLAVFSSGDFVLCLPLLHSLSA